MNWKAPSDHAYLREKVVPAAPQLRREAVLGHWFAAGRCGGRQRERPVVVVVVVVVPRGRGGRSEPSSPRSRGRRLLFPLEEDVRTQPRVLALVKRLAGRNMCERALACGWPWRWTKVLGVRRTWVPTTNGNGREL